MEQYNLIGNNYSKMAVVDPVKTYVQRPTVIKLLGNLSGKAVLDVGCGDGIISRLLANRGAKVIGYDISEKQIYTAKLNELSKPMGNKYFVASPKTFNPPMKFDKALAVMSLVYSKDRFELQEFFNSTYYSLNEKGIFVGVDIDSSLIDFNKEFYGRTFEDLGNSKMKVNFNIKDTQPFSVVINQFTKRDFENAAKSAGFKEISWKPITVSQEGVKKMGSKYWKEFKEKSPWIAFVAKK